MIEELTADRAMRYPITSMFSKRAMYDESWQALNIWIEGRLCKRMGADLGSFLGCFTWELKPAEGSDHLMCRPIFLINDSFAKENRVLRQRVHYYPNTSQSEEINFSKLAIKFSNQLTKDMVFCSIRDICRKIGEFVSRGYQCEIPFFFGTLTVKERRIKFDFNYSRFSKILPQKLYNSIEAPISELDENNPYQAYNDNTFPESNWATDSRVNMNLNNMKSNSNIVPALSLNPTSEVPTSNGGNQYADTTRAFDLTNLLNSDESRNITDMQSSSLNEPLTPTSKQDLTRIARERVVQQAFRRALEEVEAGARREEYLNYQVQSKNDEFDRVVQRKREEAEIEYNVNKAVLSTQVDEYEQRKARAKEERRDAAMGMSMFLKIYSIRMFLN